MYTSVLSAIQYLDSDINTVVSSHLIHYGRFDLTYGHKLHLHVSLKTLADRKPPLCYAVVQKKTLRSLVYGNERRRAQQRFCF